MSVSMSVLAILDAGPSYGLELKNEFEARTGGVWPLNVGQVYSTLARLERDGLVRAVPAAEGIQNSYEITPEGRARVATWFSGDQRRLPPARDELVLKLVMAALHPGVDAAAVIQTERRSAVQLLQEYTRVKSGDAQPDLGWNFLLDSLIFQAEARVRWLDACEARLGKAPQRTSSTPAIAQVPSIEEKEVLR
jgi:DNA-binding PadR family transcriptional regulator